MDTVLTAIRPTRAQFRTLYRRSKAQIVWSSLPSDLETPISAALKLAGRQPYSFLFESAEGGREWGRYSVIGIKPDLIWRCRGAEAEIARLSRSGRLGSFIPCSHPPLASLRELVRGCRIESFPDGLPPMASGLFGYLGYGMAQLMERLPDGNPDPLGIPDAVLIRPSLVMIFDNLKRSASLATTVWPRDDIEPDSAYEQAVGRLIAATKALERRLSIRYVSAPSQLTSEPVSEDTLSKQIKSNLTQDQYVKIVEKAKHYIMNGDIFQAVLSQRFSLSLRIPTFTLYRSLCCLNPSPYLFYLKLKDFSLVGSSPEVLVQVRNGLVKLRPIAGTRPRGVSPREDRQLADELLGDPKECAEHLMLLDLGRNDVGRVARIGSVRVTERMIIEYYSHVMHIVSNIEGELAAGYEALDALVAGFPAGTVSGAPKIRAMEIIDELENVRRSFYAGCVGYFASDGSMDSCITLRTALVKDEMMYVQAGCGVVADSDPIAEYQESCNKARALFSAASEAMMTAGACEVLGDCRRW